VRSFGDESDRSKARGLHDAQDLLDVAVGEPRSARKRIWRVGCRSWRARISISSAALGQRARIVVHRIATGGPTAA
jgi:hypothetical protein